MAVSIITQPVKNIYGIDSRFNSLNQLRYVFSIDVLNGADAVLIQVMDASGNTNLLGPDEQLFYVAPTDGAQIVVDISFVLLHILNVNQTEYLRYLIQYAHISDAGVTDFQNSEQIVINYSRLPGLLPNGSNMADYLIKDRGLPPFDLVPPVKPLTDFDITKQNIVWRSFKKTIDFIADSELAARIPANDVVATVRVLDGTGAVIFSVTPQTILANDSIKEVIINQEAGPLSIDSLPTAKYVSLELTAVSLPAQPLNASPYYFLIQNPCNPAILLGWINQEGGIEHWVFERDFLITEQADKGVRFDRALIEDISTQQVLIGRISDEIFSESLLLTAENITTRQKKALAGIKNARKVWIALNKNDTKRVDVVAESNFITEYQVRDSLTSFSCSVRLPNNIQIDEILDYSNVG